MVQVRFSNVNFEKIVKMLKLKVSCYKNIVESAAEFETTMSGFIIHIHKCK